MVHIDGVIGGEYAPLVVLSEAIAGNVATSIGHALQGAALSVVACSFGPLLRSEVARLYAHNLGRTGPGRVDVTWMSRTTFSAGPSIKLLLRAERGDAVDYVRELKVNGVGGSSLRSLGRFSGKGMSLVHSPDDDGQATADLPWLFGLDAAASIISEGASTIDWAVYERLASPVRLDGGLAPVDIVLSILDRFLLAVAFDFRLWVRGGVAVYPQSDVWDAPEARLVGGELHDHAVRLLGELEATWRCDDAIETAYRAERLIALSCVVAVTSGKRGGLIGERLCTSLRNVGFATQAWEEQLLLSYFVPVP